MKSLPIVLLLTACFFQNLPAQELPTDYLPAEFHKSRRDSLRSLMPANSVAVFFSNPIRNRANDVEYVYHQDPDFYYLTGYQEPHSMLVLFSDWQKKTGRYPIQRNVFCPGTQ